MAETTLTTEQKSQLRVILRKTDDVDLIRCFIENFYFFETIASNPHTPVDILDDLSTHIVDVRQCVAENPSTPLHTMTTLADDDSEYVRASLASNKKLPDHLFDKLARDSHERVLWEVNSARELFR